MRRARRLNESDGTMGDVQSADEPRRQFLDLLAQVSGKAAPMRLVLSKYQGDEADLLRVRHGRWSSAVRPA